LNDGFEKFFRTEQVARREGELRPKLTRDLFRHIEAHVGRQRTATVQEGFDKGKLFRT
jgi:hypothetical protein